MIREHQPSQEICFQYEVSKAGGSGRCVRDDRDTHLLFQMGEQLATARIPPGIHGTLRLGRLTALQKPRGGVRGIVVGDVVRRLVGRTMAQQLGKVVEAATAPHQHALSTRAGTECVAHVLQVPTTIVSIDGVGAYDSISRKAMLEALMAMPGGSEAPLHVTLFYGQPSRYLWEDESGNVHHKHQGEGGEQEDVLRPLLFSLGQHSPLEAVRARLINGERLFAFLDDVYVMNTPNGVGTVHNILQEELNQHSRIHINIGKTQVGNAVGIRPPACDQLTRIAQTQMPGCGRGPGCQRQNKGSASWERLLGHPDFVQAFVRKVLEEHDVLSSCIPWLRMCSRRVPSSCIVQMDARTSS